MTTNFMTETKKADENVLTTVGHAFAELKLEIAKSRFDYQLSSFRENEEYVMLALIDDDWVGAFHGYNKMHKTCEEARRQLNNGLYPERYRAIIESFEESTRRMLSKLIIAA